MNKNITIRLKEDTILKILKIYYKKNEDFTGKLEIRKRIQVKTRYNENYDAVEISFLMMGTMEFLGEEIPNEREVPWKEAMEIVKGFLEENNLKVQEIESDSKIEYENSNSGEEKEVIFNGIKCQVNKFEKHMKKVKE